MPSEKHRDELFDSLANSRRRALLACLDDRETPVSACELAQAVWKEVADAPDDDPPTESVQRIYLSLHHVHLPKLASAEVIDYDPNENVVTDGPRFESAVELLRNAPE